MKSPILCAALLTCGLAQAFTQTPSHYVPAPNESQLIEHGHYTNKSGQSVHSPAHSKDGKVPPGASAQCRDGSYSFSQHHSGTCSGHHGVANWMN